MYTRICVTLFLASQVIGMDNLRVAYEWKVMDFQYPTDEDRTNAINNKEFIPENNMPLGLEVYENRIFITLPRWKDGVPASIGYIFQNDTKDSPKLHPYPNWEAHKTLGNDTPQIVSPFRIRADACGRLWILDSGLDNLAIEPQVKSPAKLLVYSLRNDALLRMYEIPESQKSEESFFANIVVEDHDCDNSFAYLADIIRPALVVYSWKSDSSWVIKHNFFHMDPLAGVLNVSMIEFVWEDGIFGLALSGPDSEGYSTLYFHPMISYNEYSVSTKVLRNESLTDNFHYFKLLGSRGTRSQSGASFLHKKTNVLFYALVNLNAVACWRTTNPSYTMESQGRIFMSNVTMVFPNDIKVDNNDNLWVLSDKLPVFIYDQLYYGDVNFRILTAKVEDAIRGTTCDSKLVISPTIVDKIMPVIKDNNITLIKDMKRTSGAVVLKSSFTLFMIMVLAMLSK